jgi:hypothetical protein
LAEKIFTLTLMQQKMKKINLNYYYIKIFNKVSALLILLLNLYFIALTFITIKEGGEPMGFGFFTLPITLLINLLVIPALLVLRKKHEKNIGLFIINFVGVCFASLLFLLLIMTPRID